jgi:ABC-type phosphonate transport system ATPase subunit
MWRMIGMVGFVVVVDNDVDVASLSRMRVMTMESGRIVYYYCYY